MTERKMFTIEVLIRLIFRMIFFTFIHTLCGSCIISEDYPKRNCISCLREVVFLKFIVIILWDDFRLSFLTLDYSRVVYPSWDSSTIPDNILCSYQAWDGWKKDVGHQGSHSHLISLVLLSLLYACPCGS
jgi:hypothetical protein